MQSCIAHAAGTTISEDTISAPTVRAATDTVIAVISVNSVFTAPTFTPASLAERSSNEMYSSAR